LASLDVARARATPQLVVRTPDGIVGAPDDYFLVSVHTKGRCLVRQDGRAAMLENMGFVLFDTSRPYELQTSDFEQFVVRMPKATLLRHLPTAESLTALAVDGEAGAGPLVHSAIRSLAHDVGMLSPEAGLAVAHGIEHLLIAGLSTLMPGPDRSAAASKRSRLALIQQYIRENIRDENLGIASISSALHLSPSSIHRTFAAGKMTAMGWIWQQRLEGIHQELSQGIGPERTLTQIARAWGFSDSAHFSRAFRRRYGYPPSSLRK
jgi:AraC-like DNA-binding protein